MRPRDDLVFPMVEYERRLRELRQRMEARQIDAMLVTTPENICYLTGFESPGHYYFNGLVIPLEGEPFIVPRQLEDSGVQALTWLEISRPYQDFDDPMEVLHRALQEFDLHDRRIGYEKQCWFFTAAQQETFFALARSARFVDCSMIVEAGRVIKSDYEIELMRQAARAAEAGMRAGIEAVQAGVTENDIAAEIHYAMIKAGSEWPAIAPFVASGYRGAIGHATWAGRRIEPNDIVMLEVGGCLKRYHTALMRTGFVGEPSPEVRAAEQTVLEAFQAMMDFIRPGVPAGAADAVGREIIARSNSGGTQFSRSAYSIGISLPPDWGEGYILSMQPREERPLEANMTFHLLPWVQVAGKGGISISETIRVTPDGCERLTDFERGIFVR
jgi:Xaa-Pro dipeptidase